MKNCIIKIRKVRCLPRQIFLREATKYLAEENGKIPTVQELSSYTHILEEEILQIMGLSEDTKRVAAMPEPQPEQIDAEEDVIRSLIMISAGFFVAEEEISERNCKTINAVVCENMQEHCPGEVTRHHIMYGCQRSCYSRREWRQ